MNTEQLLQVDVVIELKNGQFTPTPTDLSRELEQSGNCPVNIDWTPRNEDQYDRFPDPRDHASILVGHLHRWKHISIYVNYMPLKLFSSTRNTANGLEEVCIQAPMTAFDTPAYGQRISSIWSNAPNFRSYTIKHWNEDASRSEARLSGLHLPYANLTTFRIDTVIPLDECIEILSLAYGLRHCRFGSIARPKKDCSNAKVHHDTLQSLFIASCWEEYDRDVDTFAHRLLAHVRTVDLRRLVVENECHWDANVFEEFVDESGCDLKALEFHMVKIHAGPLFATLSTHCPNIRVFKIFADPSQDPPPISQFSWDRLKYTGKSSQSLALPKLTILFVNDVALNGAASPGEVLADVVQSRLGQGLQVVWFQPDDTETSLNAYALRNMFPMHDDLRSDSDLKPLVIDKFARPTDWDDCIEEYLWPRGDGWRPEGDVDSDGDDDGDDDSDCAMDSD